MEIIDFSQNCEELSANIADAATAIRTGQLVAFPTETVYGLGANAWNESAILQIFQTKGRPQDNPLIVHIATQAELEQIVAEVSPEARLLYDTFSPGPLTLIHKKHPQLPNIISAGLDTVAVRIPDHPIAQALLRQAGVPIVAPSANKSGRPSPTTAEHVIADYGRDETRIAYLLNGGSAECGVESTVLDLTTDPPTLLRPGSITQNQIEATLQRKIQLAGGLSLSHTATTTSFAPKSPGMKYRHYAPNCQVLIARGATTEARATELARLGAKMQGSCGYLGSETTLEEARRHGFAPKVSSVYSGDFSVKSATRRLFAGMRMLENKVQTIIVEGSPYTAEAAAFLNRLEKAAATTENNSDGKQVIFISTANCARAPMAMACFNIAYNNHGAKAIARGLTKQIAKRLPDTTVAVASDYGINLRGLVFSALKPKEVQAADIIVTMTKAEAVYLRQVIATKDCSQTAKVITFGEFVGDVDLEIAEPKCASIESHCLTWQIFFQAFAQKQLEDLNFTQSEQIKHSRV